MGGFLYMLAPNLVSILGYLCSFRGYGHFIAHTYDDFYWFSINHHIFCYNYAFRYSIKGCIRKCDEIAL